MTRFRALGFVGVAALVTAGGTAYLAGRRTVEHRPIAASSTTTTARSPELLEVRNEPAGFVISYPKAWTRLDAADPQVMLVASEKGEQAAAGGSILTRVIDLPNQIGAEHLDEARKSTDGIVARNPSVELKAEPTRLDLGGVPGYFYFYTFLDTGTGRRGVHSHYFLFKGAKMITIVFQALPDTDFVRLAPTFDQVAASFRIS